MTSVITGDIIKSTHQVNDSFWLSKLNAALAQLAVKKADYELFRGDSFQIEIPNYAKSFEAAVYIKACIKSVKNLDVRMAIGIGNKSYKGKSVSLSNGKAFVFSGHTFETLKREKINLKVKTNNSSFDELFNLYFRWALITMDSWSTNSAEVVKLSMEYPGKTQAELAKHLGINQDAVSKRRKRAFLEEIQQLNRLYIKKVKLL